MVFESVPIRLYRAAIAASSHQRATLHTPARTARLRATLKVREEKEEEIKLMFSKCLGIDRKNPAPLCTTTSAELITPARGRSSEDERGKTRGRMNLHNFCSDLSSKSEESGKARIPLRPFLQPFALTQISISGPVYFLPSKTSGAAYGGDPKVKRRTANIGEVFKCED
jgi:hypothetical protein